MNHQIAGQYNLFDFLDSFEAREQQPPKKVFPQKGDIIYKVLLDTVRPMKLLDVRQCNGKQILDFQNISISTYDMEYSEKLGSTLFLNKIEARNKAEENAKKVIKCTPEDLMNTTEKMFSACKLYKGSGEDMHDIEYITLALTRYGIYEKKEMYYPFLHRYSDLDAAAAKFKSMCKKYENDLWGDRICVHLSVNFKYEDVYFCTEHMYAGLEYALRHGAIYQEVKV